MDHDKAYEVLGVKPGVSNRDLKAAHRDLAKVWHPDRFLHDPRLQEKAQEKLKEINEAYELLISGKTPRPAPAQAVYSQPRRQTRRRSGSWAFALLVFAGVFAVTTKVQFYRRTHQPVQEPEVVEQPEQPESPAEVVNKTAKPNKENTAAPEVATNETVATPTTALATVTVTVDPETGLLAKPECRLRSRMTYPSGSEPTAYCNLSHAPPPKESRVKSIAKTVKRALD